MRTFNICLFTLFGLLFCGCKPKETQTQVGDEFPKEIKIFRELDQNPVFRGTDENTWDRNIRERGYILKEEDRNHMWYTGFKGYSDSTLLKLGYAS